MKQRPKVGVAAIIRKDGKVLIGKRKVPLGKNKWAFPGGHLEMHETLEDGIKREVFEETGIAVSEITFFSVTNDTSIKDNTHYITLFFTCNYISGTVQNMEPHKCEGWEWVSWDKLPSPVFLPIENLLKQHVNPFSK